MTETKEKSPFVTIENLSQYFCVSVSTIRAWVRQGYIPENTYIKLGNTYRFNRPAVAEALTQMQKDGVELGQDTSESTTVEVTGVEGSVLTMGEPNEPDENQLEFDFDTDEDA
jgi:excisionase family DNA binding protein